jgi:hypothetical protein
MREHAERLLFVVDVSADAAAPCLPGVSRLQAAVHAIGLIMLAKSRVCPAHRYALAVLRDRAELVTSTFAESLAAEQLTALAAEAPYGPFDTTSLAEVYAQALALDDAASASAPSSSAAAGQRRRGGKGRIILFYMRSHVPPAPPAPHSPTPGVPVDALFIHGGTSADAGADAESSSGSGPDATAVGRASTQAVWTALETQLDALSLAADPLHNAYIFESTGSNIRKVLAHASLLACHPAQRPLQVAVAAPADLAAFLPPG